MTSTARAQAEEKLAYRELFAIFLRAGLTFGGGLGILAMLEDELVTKRRLLSREEFLTIYAIGRIVPSGTATALAVGYGHRFGGLPGTVIALLAMVLPGFSLAVLLTVGYGLVRNGPLFDLMPVTLLPAAVALIVAAALRLGRHVFRPSVELLIALVAFGGAVIFPINPALLLLLGGAVGVVCLRGSTRNGEAG